MVVPSVLIKLPSVVPEAAAAAEALEVVVVEVEASTEVEGAHLPEEGTAAVAVDTVSPHINHLG